MSAGYTIALIGCSKMKAGEPAPAEHLYTSPLFTKSLAHARSVLRADLVLVLSAQHHVVDLDQRVAPYDLSMEDLDGEDRKAWAGVVASRLAFIRADHPGAAWHAYCGAAYVQQLPSWLRRQLTEPLAGLTQGARLHKLTADLHAPPQPRGQLPLLPGFGDKP